jgi:hypothetical protein
VFNEWLCLKGGAVRVRCDAGVVLPASEQVQSVTASGMWTRHSFQDVPRGEAKERYKDIQVRA